jgi:hypothetical protein
MLLWLLLYTQVLLAQDQSVEEYCFSSIPKMKEVSARLKFILVPVDKTQEDKNCFTVITPRHRRELIQQYVKRLEPSVNVGFSSAEIKTEPCRIKVEKIRLNSKQGVNAGLFPEQPISLQADQSSESAKDVTTIQTIKEFELTVNQDVVKGECRVINSIRYEISLEIRRDPQPLTPPVPTGTTVPSMETQKIKTQETSSLQTTIQLNAGETIEMGSVVKNLKDQATKIDIQSGASANQMNVLQNEKIFLSID